MRGYLASECLMLKDLIRSGSAGSSGKLLEISLSCQNRKKRIFEALWKTTELVHGLRKHKEKNKHDP